MDRWLTYINERFPQILWGSLPLGLALSGGHLNGTPIKLLPAFIVFIGAWIFLFLLRIMNDLKDFDIDRRAYPGRPLPRGLIAKGEASKLALFIQILLFAYSQLVWIILQGSAALAYLALCVYAWLYYRDFMVPSIMSRYPFVKGIMQHIFIFPLAFFAVGASQPGRVFGIMAWSYAIMLFGAFLLYDISRKLNPHAHPILGTYIHFYGFNKTFLVCVCALALCAAGAFNLDMVLLLWPVETFVFLSFAALYYDAELYRAPELACTASLFIHVWAGIF